MTTPPCQEGVRWHVLREALSVAPNAVRRLELALAYTYNAEGQGSTSEVLGFRANNRLLQDAHGRQVWQCAGRSSV